MKRAAITFSVDDDQSPYVKALQLSGVEPILGPPHPPIASLDNLPALPLAGGTDANPSLSGQHQPPPSQPQEERC